MEINVTVNHKLDESAIAFIRSLFSEDGAAPVKAKPAAGSKAAPVKPAAEKETPGETDVATEEVTIEAIRAVLVEKKDAGKSDAIKALLATFDVKSATNLDKKDYAAFIIKLRKL